MRIAHRELSRVQLRICAPVARFAPRNDGARSSSRPAERLQHALIRQRRVGIGGEIGLVLVWLCQHRDQLLERRIIVVFHGGLDHGLDAVVARNEGRVDGVHGGLAFGGLSWLEREARAPAAGPFIEGRRIRELRADVGGPVGSGVAETAEGEGEISLVIRHRVEQVLHQRLVAVARREQSDLAPQAGLIGGGETLGEFAEDRLRLFDRLVLVGGEQRQQALGQPGQVPQRDPRLVGVGITPLGSSIEENTVAGSYASMKAHGP